VPESPDLVLYINGIALDVIELKKGRTAMSEGIRQLVSNQKPEFNEWFFLPRAARLCG